MRRSSRHGLAALAATALAAGSWLGCGETINIIANGGHGGTGGQGATTTSSAGGTGGSTTSSSTTTGGSSTTSSSSSTTSSSTTSGADGGDAGAIGPVFGGANQDLYFGPLNDGYVDCGTQAAQKTVSISNTGDQPYAWRGLLVRGPASPFSISPSSGTVMPGASVTITVTPVAPMPAHASMTPNAYTDQLRVFTDIPNDAPHRVTLFEMPHGAVVVAAPVAVDGVAVVDFGGVAPGAKATAPITFTNVGTASVDLQLATGQAAFGASPTGSNTVFAAGQLAATVSFAPGTSSAAQTGTLTLSADPGDVLCAPLPVIALRGSGSVGPVSVSPAALDFGKVDCGATAGTLSLTVTSSVGTFGVPSMTLAAGASSPFAVGYQNGCGLGSPATCVITVFPKPIPTTADVSPNGFGDLLTVTTGVTGDAPHVVPLRMTAQGAVLSFETDHLTFGAVPYGDEQDVLWGVTNDGNADIFVGLTIGSGVIQTPGFGDIPAHGSRALDVAFRPTTVQGPSPSGDVYVNDGPGHRLCKPLPLTTLAFTASGSAVPVTVDAKLGLEFAPTACGAQAAPLQFVLRNGTAAAIAVTAAMAKGGSSPFSVSPAAPSIPAGGTLAFTVTPKAIAAVAPTRLHAFDDTVILTTDAPGDGTHVVSVYGTARGAILDFSPTTLLFPSTTAGQSLALDTGFFVMNRGNDAIAGLGLSLDDMADFAIGAPASFGVDPSTPLVVGATFQPGSPGLKSGMVTVSLNGSTVCGGPSQVQLTGTGN